MLLQPGQEKALCGPLPVPTKEPWTGGSTKAADLNKWGLGAPRNWGTANSH